MINGIVIAPTFLKSTCAVGQIERHFLPNLSDDFFLHIICADDGLNLQGDGFITHIVKERKAVLKADLIFRKLGWSDLVYSPDATFYSWNRGSFNAAAAIIKQEKVDFILTINNPVSAHLIGYEIKTRYGIPWIAHFYDPWRKNAFRKYKCKYFAKKDAEREQLVAEYADWIFFPNKELLESFANTYGDGITNKLSVMPFTTEIPNMEVSHEPRDGDVLNISHIGTLSEDRRADVFIYSISRLFREHPDDRGRLIVNIVGNITETDKQLIIQEGLCDVVNIAGRVTEEECIRYYEAADIFLIIDINCSPNLFYPSKLLKYYCYKKPIVGLTKQDSVVAHELSATGNRFFSYNDYVGLSEYIHHAICNYEYVNHNDKTYYKRFLIENTRTVFEERVRQVIK